MFTGAVESTTYPTRFRVLAASHNNPTATPVAVSPSECNGAGHVPVQLAQMPNGRN